MAKLVNDIELCGTVARVGGLEVGDGRTGRRARCVSLPLSVSAKESRYGNSHGLSMGTGEGRDGEGRQRVKGIYCQEPSVPGNGYA